MMTPKCKIYHILTAPFCLNISFASPLLHPVNTHLSFQPQQPHPNQGEPLIRDRQRSPTFLAPGTGFVEDNFSIVGEGWGRGGWLRR